MEEKWFRTDIIPEFLSAVTYLNRQLIELDEKNDWRWVVFGGAYLLQCACTSAIHHSNTLGIYCLEDRDLRKWYDYHHSKDENKTPPKSARVAGTATLFDRCVEGELFPKNCKICFTREVINDCKKLLEFRNAFMHFDPKGWSIETSGFPRILFNLTIAGKTIASELPNLRRHISTSEVKELLSQITQAQTKLAKYEML